MMNRWDIFVITFYCLDDYWDDHQTDELGNICSSMNPFFLKTKVPQIRRFGRCFVNITKKKNIRLKKGLKLLKSTLQH